MFDNVKRELFKGVYYTAIAKYAGIVVSLIVGAILARLISPEDFGIVVTASVLIQFFGNFSDLGIEPAIIQHKELTKRDHSNIFSFTVWSGVTISVMFFFLSWPISNYYEDKTLLIICQISAITLLFSTINIVPSALLYKDKLFKFIAYRSLVVQIIGGAASVVAAFCGLGLYSLIINPVFSSIVILIINYRKYPLKLSFTFGTESIKHIFSYSFYQFLFNLINYFSRNLDKLIVGKYLGFNMLGFYEKSYSLMMKPLQNITHVVSPVMHPIFSEYQNDFKKLASSYEKVIRFLAFVGFPLSVLLFFTARELILIVFGPIWGPSVPSFEILSISVGIQIILATSGSIFQAANSTKELFISGLLSTALTVPAILIAVLVFKTIEAVAWSITVSFTINFIQAYLIMYLGVFKRNILSLFKQFISPIVLSSILIAANLLFNRFVLVDNLILSLFAKSIVSLTFYIGYIQFSGEYNLYEKAILFFKKPL